MVLLNLLLGILNAAGNHAVLYHLTFLEAQTVHHTGNTLAGKQTHQLILDRNEEDTATWVTLTTGTATQLTVNTTALVTLGTNNGQTAGSLYLGSKLDIGTTTGHIGGNGNSTQHTLLRLSVHHNGCKCAGTSLSNNVRLLLVQLGVQYLMRNLAHLKHLAQHLGNLHAGSTHQNGTTRITHLFYLFYNGLVLLALCAVNTVVHIVTYYLAVCGNLYNVQLVDIPELTSLGNGGTRHT